jgi:hypothetical protein
MPWRPAIENTNFTPGHIGRYTLVPVPHAVAIFLNANMSVNIVGHTR